MDIKQTRVALEEMKETSERLKRGFMGMALLAPQILGADDLHELRDLADEVATNFNSCSVFLYSFGRIGQSSKFAPQGKIDIEK